MKWKVNLIAGLILSFGTVKAQKVNVNQALQAAAKQTDVLIKNVDSLDWLNQHLCRPEQ